MANLVVRNIDEDIVRALKERAGIQARVLRLFIVGFLPKHYYKSFLQVLVEMPNVGEGSDFELLQDSDDVNVFSGYESNKGILQRGQS